ncbi:hypothetical protein Kuja_1190 [Vibrio phage vB_VchM_Kuja]|uniref:DNA primase n=1 Tax=Vibrio phage vB_VchM_Kuja TaxID=2686437 RepID=A0A6B9J596_9CAUD|nr:hypothetical protein HWC83_gp117 [Vibrio phage vB_VchM_Kuja]QGZ16110.1 hypothetical protein Kuja_1190 [Vibrio phage vB_VchM_Kuja]
MREVDEDFIQRVAGNLERFGWERGGLARFSCPFCNDTKKRRGYLIYRNETDAYHYYCHNCDVLRNARMGTFLRNVNNLLADEYFFEQFKQSADGQRQRKTIDQIEQEEQRAKAIKARPMPLFKPTQTVTDPVFETMVRLKDLPDDHYAKKYVIGRNLPNFAIDLFWFTNDWKKTCESFDPEETEPVKKLINDEPRLVIPFYGTTGKIQVIQGRSFQADAKLRYLTCKKTKNTEKTFGLERLDFSKPKLVVEGPIDSLFIPNCVATADANLLKFDGDIYIPDNQYRNSEVCRGISKIIEANKRVVLFPENVYEKDINDMVKNRGIKEVLNIIRNNIFKGIVAETRFNEVKKC